MPADYAVIQDGKVRLTENVDTKEVSFTAPGFDPSKPPILLLVAESRISDDPNIGLSIRVNGGQSETFRFKTDERHSLHAILDPGSINLDDSTLVLRLRGTDGSINVADIVLLYRKS